MNKLAQTALTGFWAADGMQFIFQGAEKMPCCRVDPWVMPFYARLIKSLAYPQNNRGEFIMITGNADTDTVGTINELPSLRELSLFKYNCEVTSYARSLRENASLSRSLVH